MVKKYYFPDTKFNSAEAKIFVGDRLAKLAELAELGNVAVTDVAE